MSVKEVIVFDLLCDRDGCSVEASSDLEYRFSDLADMRAEAHGNADWFTSPDGRDFCARHWCPECESTEHAPWACIGDEAKS